MRSAVQRKRLQGINRTSRFKTAGISQPGAQKKPIGLDNADQQALRYAMAMVIHAASPAAEALALDTACIGKANDANNWVNSMRTCALSAGELALLNCLTSKPVRKRTTTAMEALHRAFGSVN